MPVLFFFSLVKIKSLENLSCFSEFKPIFCQFFNIIYKYCGEREIKKKLRIGSYPNSKHYFLEKPRIWLWSLNSKKIQIFNWDSLTVKPTLLGQPNVHSMS